MKLDQNNPMHWIASGAALVVLGLIIYSAVDDGAAFGTTVAGLGVILGAVGLVIMAVRGRTSRSEERDDGVG